MWMLCLLHFKTHILDVLSHGNRSVARTQRSVTGDLVIQNMNAQWDFFYVKGKCISWTKLLIIYSQQNQNKKRNALPNILTEISPPESYILNSGRFKTDKEHVSFALFSARAESYYDNRVVVFSLSYSCVIIIVQSCYNYRTVVLSYRTVVLSLSCCRVIIIVLSCYHYCIVVLSLSYSRVIILYSRVIIIIHSCYHIVHS